LNILKKVILFPTFKIFTGHGTIMAATMLNNPIDVEASVAVVRTFIKFREILSQNKDMSRRLIEMKLKHDHQFKAVFETIRKLMQLRQNDIKRTRIRYRRSNEKDKDE